MARPRPAASMGTGSGQPKQLGVGGGLRLLAALTLLPALLLLLLQPQPSTSSVTGTHSPTPPAGADQSSQSRADADELSELVPSSDSLFKPNQLEPEELDATDCHLRNMDICYAGLMSSGAKPMPTTSAELETRCDELRLTASCLAIFNKRCHTFRVFSLLAPATQLERAGRLQVAQAYAQLNESRPVQASSRQLVVPPADQLLAGNVSLDRSLANAADLQTLCDPASAKQLPGTTKSTRQNFFRIARCVNERASSIRPCVADLRTALQLFFEPQRKLPLNATCCATLRFRDCSTRAIDNLCGLGSYQQLEKLLGSVSGAFSSTQLFTSTMDRLCKKATGSSPNYCAELLPPSGMQIAERRGRKASKIAKLLGLFSMANTPDAAGL